VRQEFQKCEILACLRADFQAQMLIFLPVRGVVDWRRMAPVAIQRRRVYSQSKPRKRWALTDTKKWPVAQIEKGFVDRDGVN
jgi:hypothetical protein